jgi:hypothetical protein
MGYSPPTLYIRSYPVQNRGYTNFRKYVKGEVQLPRIPLPETVWKFRMGTVLGSQGLAQWGEKAPLVNLLRYQTRAEPSLQLFSRQSLHVLQ